MGHRRRHSHPISRSRLATAFAQLVVSKQETVAAARRSSEAASKLIITCTQRSCAVQSAQCGQQPAGAAPTSHSVVCLDRSLVRPQLRARSVTRSLMRLRSLVCCWIRSERSNASNSLALARVHVTRCGRDVFAPIDRLIDRSIGSFVHEPMLLSALTTSSRASADLDAVAAAPLVSRGDSLAASRDAVPLTIARSLLRASS